jgi:hypothetical protein
LKAERERSTNLHIKTKPSEWQIYQKKLKSRRAWNGVFQALTENNCQPRLLYPAKLSIIEGEIKTFHDKTKGIHDQ